MAARSRLPKQATCSAPVNIAVIKYWGKRDEERILPINSSLSATLSCDEMCSTTSAMLREDFTRDRLWLNGVEEDVAGNKRLQSCLQQVRMQYAKQQRQQQLLQDGEQEEDLSKYSVHICSRNNFPTAAGLASSAAGYACLVATLAKLYGLKGDLSGIARQGSGSACRSMYGGFVSWEMGAMDDGSDSVALQVAPASHWAGMEVLILVVSDQKKPVSSTAGMRTSVQTSQLLKYRADVIVPRLMTEMKEAILEKNFQAFGKMTMQDSNQFHAICLDTYPPISYLNGTSQRIIQLVTAFNNVHGSIKAAYTFDAGPNAVIYTLSQDVPLLLSLVSRYFPPPDGEKEYVRGISTECPGLDIAQDFLDRIPLDSQAGLLKYIIHTKVGEGPVVKDTSLLDEKGFPL